MTVLKQYKAHLESKEILHDEAQNKVVNELQNVYDELTEISQSLTSKGIRQLKRVLNLNIKPVQGLYIWGGVGRGKTYLMDLFYDALPFQQKSRLHFHHFMMLVHEELKKCQGQGDPLKITARKFTEKNLVLCFDEFYVSDIADAMLMANLFECFFDQGLTLIATSNIHPDNLYHNGLQRSKFLPTIDLIKKYCEIFELDSGKDYRLQYLEAVKIFHHPLDKAAEENLKKHFHHLATHNIKEGQPVRILEREIHTIKLANDVVWFSFFDICKGARSQYDYIEIAKLYRTVLISDVVQMGDEMNDVAKRFIMMVDEFYDHHVTLMMSIECPLEQLYNGRMLAFEFKRTLSRLHEMKSNEYLSLQHIA